MYVCLRTPKKVFGFRYNFGRFHLDIDFLVNDFHFFLSVNLFTMSLQPIFQALQFVVNHREDPKQPPKVSERLNRYIDSLLRKSQKNINETDIDAQLSNAITIFRYIDDKDLFQKVFLSFLFFRK